MDLRQMVLDTIEARARFKAIAEKYRTPFFEPPKELVELERRILNEDQKVV